MAALVLEWNFVSFRVMFCNQLQLDPGHYQWPIGCA